MEDKGGKGKEKKGTMTREQKMERLLSKKYKDHKDFLKELVSVEFEDLGINPESVLGNKEEMDEFIRQKKVQLRKIESTSQSQIENEENPDDNDETRDQGQQIPCHISNYRTQIQNVENPDDEGLQIPCHISNYRTHIQNVENPDEGQPSTSHISSMRTQIDEGQQTTSPISSKRTQIDEEQQTTNQISNTRTQNENDETSDIRDKDMICPLNTECDCDFDLDFDSDDGGNI
ncbi:hypothetical protein NE237_001629 [Protea cynaroides]|uniref:Uncharacterized protein n=1 Tax=Protea cynaroides TaxID=273540 RepID=A0A9Q0KTI0_9MAGN|nr:hypothetical protein NE237_001629 [Protea cynaroides]